MILTHGDRKILRFKWIESQRVRAVSVSEWKHLFIPFDFKGEVSDESIRKYGYYKLPKDRLCAIENFLQKRILQIEEYGKKADDIFKVSGKSGTVNPVNGESLALQILANLKADPFVSYDELSELMEVPRRTVARRIKELSDAGKSAA